VSEARTYADVNAVVGSYLRDFAFAQSSQQKMFGYKRPAAAILALDMPLTELIQPDGTLSRIGGIGPDAHTTAQLSYAETALAHARLAGIPADRIVYCWPLERLLAWFADPLCECRQ
jgi:hypothetical protein